MFSESIAIMTALRRAVGLCLVLIGTLGCWAAGGPAQAQQSDRHVGYYYPEPQVHEKFDSSMITAPIASSRSRAAFAVGIALMQNKRNFAPTYHLFVKGARKEKLIIVATETNRYATHYQLRALLAAMTSEARSTPLFNKLPEPEKRTFLDFCKFMGFTRLTISNGKDLALQFTIQ